MNSNKDWSVPASCSARSPLNERPFLTPEQASEMASMFKVLASDTRLRLIHALVRAGEMHVTNLAEVLGMKPQAVCNQLQRLADRGILGSRRNGLNIYYRILDPCVVTILDHGLCLSEDAKARSR